MRRSSLIIIVPALLTALYYYARSGIPTYDYVKEKGGLVPQSEALFTTTTEQPNVPDPYEVYILSTYFYPTSESMGNNNVGMIFVAPYEWPEKIGTVTVRATNGQEIRTTSCNLEIYDCKMLGIFAGCHGLPNMNKFEISLGEQFHEIPFKPVSYEKREVVTCVAPLFAAEQWHQIVFAAHIYRKYGSFMHLYVRSIIQEAYELGYMKVQPHPRLKFSSIPDYMYNPNMDVSFRAQDAVQSDCLLQYKESAQFITFMDLDDILIPRNGPTNYLEEFEARIAHNEFIHYKKQNIYYEANSDPKKFSMFDIFHSARLVRIEESGKIALIPKYANHTQIHTVERNRVHNASYPFPNENAIIHLKTAYPMNFSKVEKKFWPYIFMPDDSTIFHEKDGDEIEKDYKRISAKYPEVWEKLPVDLVYFPIILNCFNKKYYDSYYKDPKNFRYCMNPDLCKIPPSLVKPCANADGDFFSSEAGSIINVHYATNVRFTIGDRCVP